MTVWILMKGEDGQGGDVHGVFADKDYARAEFDKLVREVEKLTLDAGMLGGPAYPYTAADGSVRAHCGGDWAALEPHEVQGPLASPAGGQR